MIPRCIRNALALALIAACGSAAVAQSPLTTMFGGTGTQNFSSPVTVYFDLTVSSSVIITGFDVNVNTSAVGANYPIQVWITSVGGSYVGNTDNPSVWTQVSSGAATAAAADTATYIDTPDFPLSPGTYGVAIVCPNGSRYTNGNGSNQNFSTAELAFAGGASRSTTSFTGGTYFDPRIFNGRIHYISGDLSGTGACCLADGSCSVMVGADCYAGGNTPRGAGSTCPPSPSCTGPGICCGVGGVCTSVLQATCNAAGGLWSATGSCSPSPCAAVPANDTCATAVALGSGPTAFPYATTVSIQGANHDSVSVSCNTGSETSANFGVWYTCTAPADGALLIGETSATDVVWAVWSGASCPGSTTQPDLLCDVNDQNRLVPLTSGTTAYILLARQGSGNTLPTVSLTATFNFVPILPNDLCSNATVLGSGPTAFPYSPVFSNAGCTDDPVWVPCNTGSPTNVRFGVWFTYVPAVPGTLTFTETSSQNSVWAVWRGADCPAPADELPVFCSTTDTAQSVTTTFPEIGVPLHILIGIEGNPNPPLFVAGVTTTFNFIPAPINDTCQGATTLALNTPIAGDLSGAAEDYTIVNTDPPFSGNLQISSFLPGRDLVYTFVPPATGAYSFRVSRGSGANLALYVTDICPTDLPSFIGAATGGVIAASNRNSATTNAAEEVVNVTLTGGTQYWVFVDQVTSVGAGTFVLEANKYSGEVEPNDTTAAATPYVFGDSGMTGSISVAAEVDFYALGSPPAGSRVFALADSKAANSGDIRVRVTNATDTLEFDNDDAEEPFSTSAPVIAGAIADGGPIFLRYDGSSATTLYEPYHVYAVVRPPLASAIPETEPNDTTANANSNALNYFSGSASSASDTDLYAFNAVAGELVFLALDGDPLRNNTPINAALALLDSAGAVLLAVNSTTATSSVASGAGNLAATSPTSPGEAIVWRIQVSGTYHARVTSAAAGDYLLSISRHPVTAPTTENCCRGTTCQSVTTGTCSGTVAGSASVVVTACTGNTAAGCCYGDYDHNGTKDITDIFTFLNAWFSASTYADITSNGAATPDITDIFTFLNAWFGTCS